ncbi:MAG: hypothetical protein Kapaf2KO_16940 [Candidatus Kapaibacteriales bacterium]
MFDNELIYSTSWEDLVVDFSILGDIKDKNVLMISAAGDNVLAYLSKSPRRIDAVDQNKFQNYLLEFKHSIFTSKRRKLLSLFIEGNSAGIKDLEDPKLFADLHLTPNCQDWVIDKLLPAAKARGGIHYLGTSGKIAWTVKQLVRFAGLNSHIEELFNTDSLEEQKTIYKEKIENKLFSLPVKKLLSSTNTLKLLGVPETQLMDIDNLYEDGLFGFLKERMESLFTKLEASENHYWQVYYYGSYPKARPIYLTEESFDTISDNSDKLSIFNGDVFDYISRSRVPYDIVNLLDSLDWIELSDIPDKLKTVEDNLALGGKAIIRSARNVDLNKLCKEHNIAIAFEEKINVISMVNTYLKIWVGIKTES